jgi:general stress protein 26
VIFEAELDERFSDPGMEAVPWADTEAAIASGEIFWISTVRADGRPHVTPLVAVWHDEALHFSTGPEEQKALNIASHPYVVLSTGCNSWDRGLDVMVEGDAERVTDPGTLARLAGEWAKKWDGRWQFEPAAAGFGHDGQAGLAHVFAVRPAKILAFGKEPFTHTRYRPAQR